VAPSRDTVKRTTDVLIVGSGAIGSVYARLLTQGGYTVTMVDCGPALSQIPGDHIRNAALYQLSADSFGGVIASSLVTMSIPPQIRDYDTLDPACFNPYTTEAVVKGLVLEGQNPEQKAEKNLPDAASTYAVGGMVTHWTCAIPRPRNSGLLTEIPRRELDELYAKGERLFNHHTDLFTGSPLNEVVKRHLSEAGFDVEQLPLAAGEDPESGFIRYTGASQILESDDNFAALGDRLTILPQHLCQRLNWTEDGNGDVTIESATLLDFAHHTEVTIEADIVVVACNGILTPQLLFASGIWRDRLPALGRYLTEQPKLYGQVSMRRDLVEEIAKLAPNPDYPEHDPIPFPYTLRAPSLTIPNDPDQGRVWHTQISRDPSNEGLLPPGADERLIVQLRWFAPCTPHVENAVFFSDVYKDGMGMPQPTFNFTLDSEDARSVNAMFPDFYRAAAALGGFFPGFEGALQSMGNSLHFAGTFRIGDDPETSVCDTYSRVWNFSNLYVGGNGTIPNAISVNPTLTSAAIAIRGAERLVEQRTRAQATHIAASA
jgi:pyranose oxidase